MSGRDAIVQPIGDTTPASDVQYRAAAVTLAGLAAGSDNPKADLALTLGAIGFLDAKTALEAAGRFGADVPTPEPQKPAEQPPALPTAPGMEVCGARRHRRTRTNTRISKKGHQECLDCLTDREARKRDRRAGRQP